MASCEVVTGEAGSVEEEGADDGGTDGGTDGGADGGAGSSPGADQSSLTSTGDEASHSRFLTKVSSSS